jgi:hypothetical protein
MTSNLTPYINNTNVDNVRKQIFYKQQSTPYHSTINEASQVLTDFDSFPYKRWFRGVYNSEDPIVIEREAGWRPRHDNCYKPTEPCCETKIPYPDHCFEVPCSTVYPCYPSYIKKDNDRKFLDVMINRGCIPHYR